MPPRPASRGNPEGMTAARRLPQHKALHRGARQPHTAPCSRSPIIGIADDRLKDASGAAGAAGPCPVPDPPARSPQTAATGNRSHQGPDLARQDPVQHAQPRAVNHEQGNKTPA